jgi:hypothetical protein
VALAQDRERLTQDVFSYRAVRVLTTLRGEKTRKFVRGAEADPALAQAPMERATGNFKD